MHFKIASAIVLLSACSAGAVSSSGKDASAPDAAADPRDAAPPIDVATPDTPPVVPVDDAGPETSNGVFVPTACKDPSRSLANDVLPIVSARCSADTCHGSVMQSTSAFRSFALGPADECADARAIVVPSKPDQSYIVAKLSNHDLCPDTSPMPKPIEGDWVQLPADDVQTIYDWICGGALDD
jgi:hypothetical protein